ncbi:MAG: DUF3611 family protein [Myxacorys californica WJT36-NPBG1]|jgi:hypothetical protein|nr:DUF3611 family protein [Myxacorys californica WJT36-NPBG1]
MQTQTPTSLNQHKLDRIATVLRWAGLASFCLQFILTAAAALTLVFAITGRSFSQQVSQTTVPGVPGGVPTEGVTPGLGIGIFWAACGVVVLLANLYFAFRLTRFARRLRNPNANVHPKKAEVLQVLRVGVITGLIGMLVTILGGGATLGLLLSKAIAQPQGVAIYDPARIIRSLDVLVAIANMNGIAGNFVATTSTLGLFQWIENQHR